MAVRLQRQQAQPIHALFKFLQAKTRVEVWLYEQVHTRLEGTILVRWGRQRRSRGTRGIAARDCTRRAITADGDQHR